MNIIIWLVVGGLVGDFAGMLMRQGGGFLLNIVVGIVGSSIGGYLFGGSTINSGDFSLSSLIVSFLGSVVFLAVLGLFQRRR